MNKDLKPGTMTRMDWSNDYTFTPDDEIFDEEDEEEEMDYFKKYRMYYEQ
jgi:hypothetical protein